MNSNNDRFEDRGFSAFEQPEPEAPDVSEIHRAVLREQFEPSEGQQRVPVVLFLAFLALAMWAGWYLSEFDGDFRVNAYDGPKAFRNIGLADGEVEEVQIDPMLLGKRIYNNCSSCHQISGQGIAGQYPPLVDSEWVLGDDRILSRILLNGLAGPIEVLGKTYNAQMPAWRQLSDRDIAAVLTYIRNSWGNDSDPVSESTVSAVRTEVGSRTATYSAAELRSIEKTLADRTQAAPRNNDEAEDS